MIHRKGVIAPTEGTTEEKDIEVPDTSNIPNNLSKAQQKAIKKSAMNDVKTMVANNDTYVAAGTTQLAYTDNPLSTAPLYESVPADQITYLPINETNDAVSVYKEYSDING
ncbi:MAG: hypothetical protein WCL02_02955 [bacterium]